MPNKVIMRFYKKEMAPPPIVHLKGYEIERLKAQMLAAEKGTEIAETIQDTPIRGTTVEAGGRKMGVVVADKRQQTKNTETIN